MDFEKELMAEGFDVVIGVDEVGMGCLAGPVVVCAVSMGPKAYEGDLEVRDSKLLSQGQRQKLVQGLKALKGFSWAIRWCSAATVDRLNIYQASRLAMRRAIGAVAEKDAIVLVDGNKVVAGISHPQKAIVKGDQKVWAIAAASVLAKVYRDAMMERYAKRYPGYGFEIHKGYGTVLHQAQLAKRGPCPIHRASFAPIRSVVK